MEYSEFKLEDFLTDKFFIQWVKNPDIESNVFWKNYISNHPQQNQTILTAREILINLQFRQDSQSHKAYDEVLAKLMQRKKNSSKKLSQGSHIGWFLKVAAVFAVIFSITFSFYQFTDLQQPSTFTKNEVKQNPKGIKSQIFLPDGTKVYLNADSKISFSNPFSDSVRVVELTGEAYFEVKHDLNRPFIVKVRDIQVQALGTSFNIDAYQETDKTRVYLNSGSVKVWQEDEFVILEPGFQLTYDSTDKSFVTGPFQGLDAIAWIDGVIHFKDAEFEKVVNTLERWYGVKFIYDPDHEKVKNWRYLGDFDNQSLERVMDRMSFTKDFTYQIDDKNVTIDFN